MGAGTAEPAGKESLNFSKEEGLPKSIKNMSLNVGAKTPIIISVTNVFVKEA